MSRRCTCWKCRRAVGLEALAPSLVAAYRAERALWPDRMKARAEVLRAQRLLAHRDLQFVRAGQHRNRRYAKQRAWKLRQAQDILKSAEPRYEALA